MRVNDKEAYSVLFSFVELHVLIQFVVYFYLSRTPGSSQLINMIGSSYPTSGGSISQNQMQPGNNSLGSMGMLHDASDSAPFDINDFPQLTGRPNSAGGPQGQYGKIAGKP